MMMIEHYCGYYFAVIKASRIKLLVGPLKDTKKNLLKEAISINTRKFNIQEPDLFLVEVRGVNNDN